MIIQCGKRRLVSNRFGWKIEAQRLNKKTKKIEWREDRPAYPATLAQACEMLCERILTDNPDMDISDLPAALRSAEKEVRKYMAMARAAA